MAKKMTLKDLEDQLFMASSEIEKCREMIEWYEDRNNSFESGVYRRVLSRLLVDVSRLQVQYEKMKGKKK